MYHRGVGCVMLISALYNLTLCERQETFLREKTLENLRCVAFTEMPSFCLLQMKLGFGFNL